nr:prolyl oligopeptidase family serine peptidase [uncultured Draconibacterium sp.]
MKSSSIIFFVFQCLLLAAGLELSAQIHQNEMEKLAASQYRLTVLKMSDNGRWLTAWKTYDDNRDTLLIFDSQVPEKPVDYRIKVRDITFMGDNYMLMKSGNRAELINLEKQTSTSFMNVKRFQTLDSYDQFILHYNNEDNNRFELRRVNGDLITQVARVSSFHISEEDHIYAVMETENNEFEVLRIRNQSIEHIYHSPHKISSLTIDPDEQGIMIHEKSADGSLAELRYLDLKTKNTWLLNEQLSQPFQRAFTDVIGEGGVYYVRLWVNREKENTSLVDIWYGEDMQLEDKFVPSTQEAYYVWEPKRKNIQHLGNKDLINSVAIGSELYFLSFDPYELQDYTKTTPQLLFRYDKLKNTHAMIDTLSSPLFTSPNGQYVLYFKNKTWKVYHMASGKMETITNSLLNTPYFIDDGKSILFDGDDGLWSFDPEENELSKFVNFEGVRVTILNSSTEPKPASIRVYEKTVDPQKPLILELFDSKKNESSFILLDNGKCRTIIPRTTNYIKKLMYNKSFTAFSWLEENYNLPPRIVYKELGKKEWSFNQTIQQDPDILSLKQEIISFANSDGVPLKGILYYPLNFDRTKQYPMVVHIYQVQLNKEANRYPVVAYKSVNCDGFNLRLLLENGYFVYFPDIVYGDKGTGLSALDCVEQSLDALTSNRLIDHNKIGLIGHSHGGYETNFIATHSKRFAAYVAGAGNSDIVRSYFSFNYNFQSPFYWQYESGQYELNKSFSDDKDLYFKNNPIHYVDQVNAPVLLWTGKKDQNIYWEQTMEFYIGLKRNNKKVVALFYPHEGHVLASPEANRDLLSRTLEWFNYFLKGEENVSWIDKEIKGDAG